MDAVISILGGDVIGLQEIDDRAVPPEIFDPAVWDLVIDDDSGYSQDVLGIAVRRDTVEIVGLPDDRDADDEHSLFPGSQHDSEFPDRRDGVNVEVSVKATGDRFRVWVFHAKSRREGRANTDHRRENAARKLVEIIEQQYEETPLALLGDWNDNPDDRSLNILETGNPAVQGGEENTPGPIVFGTIDAVCHIWWLLAISRETFVGGLLRSPRRLEQREAAGHGRDALVSVSHRAV